MIRRLFVAAAVLLTIRAHAADPTYPVSAIPAKLMKDANVVKRMEEVQITINNVNEMIVRRKYALTILNEAGADYAPFVEGYDLLRQVRSVEGTLYDAAGNAIKKLKSKDVLDISAVDESSLIDGNRCKMHQFFDKDYPYTVEYDVETRFNNTFYIPQWMPNMGVEHFAVQQSAITIVAPAGYQVRFQAFNYPAAPQESMVKDKKALRWEAKELPPVKLYSFSPEWRELTTMVLFAPSDFAIQDYSGNMTSWKEFGKFIYALTKDRDRLPPAVQQKVQELTAGLTDPHEKVRVLYEYLQHQTRYISIQLGIGGWQPFEASFVAQKGYGDCKALTNYMYSLLKAAGIRSLYAVVASGEDAEPVIESFPSQQFDHVILCVPMGKDSTWLECTSQTKPAGYMGNFTCNRKALVVDENGGTLVSTPRYGLAQNLETRTIKARLDEGGNLTMHVKAHYGGTRQDELVGFVDHLSKEKVNKILQQYLDLSTYDVSNFKYEETRGALPELDEQLDVSVSGYATMSGRRIFIVPNILDRGGARMDTEEGRNVDYVFNNAWHADDTYEIEIPDGYTVEAMPEDRSIRTPYGTYAATIKIVGNKITYHRVREQFTGRFPAAQGEQISKFLLDIYKADRMRIVFAKKA